MELQHRLARQVINIAVSKAIEDMKGNVKRSIRNMIDLGLLFSTGENQKWFFNAAKNVISIPKNPYHSLAARMIADVDNDTIKKTGLNLGYSSLIYGAHKLKKKREELGFTLPWLLIFDISESDAVFLRQIEHCIKEGRELGIYSYIISPCRQDNIFAICEIAKQFEECLFVLKVTPSLISEKTARFLGRIHNLTVSLQADSTDFSRESDVNSFRLLKQNRCLYGFHVSYNEETIKQVATPEYIRSAIGLGNMFGAYIAEDGASDACREAARAFVRKERGEKGQPLVALEWYSDIQYIGEKIFSGNDYMRSSPAERTDYKQIKSKDLFTKSLLEILRGM